MRVNTPKSKKAVLPSATIDEFEHTYNIQLKLENEDEQSIFIYHKTISAICNLSKPYGWLTKVYYSETTDTNLILNCNENLTMSEPSNLVFRKTISAMSNFIASHGWCFHDSLTATTDVNFTLYRVVK